MNIRQAADSAARGNMWFTFIIVYPIFLHSIEKITNVLITTSHVYFNMNIITSGKAEVAVFVWFNNIITICSCHLYLEERLFFVFERRFVEGLVVGPLGVMIRMSVLKKLNSSFKYLNVFRFSEDSKLAFTLSTQTTFLSSICFEGLFLRIIFWLTIFRESKTKSCFMNKH